MCASLLRRMTAHPLIVTVVAFDDTGDSAYRMAWPARDLATQEKSWGIVTVNANAAERFELARQADLLVLIQSNDLELLPIVKARRAAGKPTLVEYNDNFFEPPLWAPVARAWASPLLQALYCDFMLSADAVMTTSERLAQILRQRVGEIRDLTVIENYLPETSKTLDQLLAKKSSTPSLGWAGSLGHIADVLAFAPQFKRILAAVPQCKLHLMGNAALPGLLDLPADQLQFTAWSSIENYLNFWEEVQVGVIPLLTSGYNLCRSDVKAIEMGSRAVAIAASNAMPYEAFAKTSNIPLYDNFEALADAAIELLQSQDKRDQQLSKTFSYIIKDRIGVQSTQRHALYARLLSKNSSVGNSDFTGYKHIVGEAIARKPLAELIRRTQELLKSNQADQALTELRTQVQECPYDGDVVLLYIKCLLVSGSAQAINELALARARFPRDLRFELLELQVQIGNLDTLKDKWRDLLIRVGKNLPRYQAFCGEILNLIGAQLERAPGLIELAQSALEMFPQATSLRFRIAETLRKSGRDEEALNHFALLRDQKLQLPFLRELEVLDSGYLEAWITALQARRGDAVIN